MGGPGSGKYDRANRKSTADESLSLSIRDFRERLSPGTAGTLTVTGTDERSWSISYSILGKDRASHIMLYFGSFDTGTIELPVRLQTTPTQFGGRRWWFTCPLAIQGQACNRRVGKLYLPSGKKYFGCRECHNLTYQSAQQAHQVERYLTDLGYESEFIQAFKKWRRVRGKSGAGKARRRNRRAK